MLKGKMANLTKIISILLILVILASAPYFLGRYYLSLLQVILLYIALSISWQFFSGLTKYIALGSSAFVGTGLYFTMRYLDLSYRGYCPILPFPVVILLAGLINFTFALAVGLITLRLKGIYFAIVTFGIAEVVKGIIQWLETNVAHVCIIHRPPLFDLQTINYLIYYSMLITALAISLLITFLRRSKFGLTLRMIGECEEAAAHVGVNTSLVKTLGFAISAMFMGLMGGSYAIRFPSLRVDTAFPLDYSFSFLPAIMTMLGGVGTVYGPIIGATSLTLIKEYLQNISTSYFLIMFGVIIIIIVLFMPYGIMGVLGNVKSKLFGKIKSTKDLKTPS